MKIVYIIWLRQIKRYFRSRSRMIGSLGQPLLFLVALGFGFSSIYQKAEGADYMQFLAPGIVAMSVLFAAIFHGLEVIWDRQFGFLKETLVAPVTRFEIMAGRTLGGATVASVQGILVLFLSMLLGFRSISLVSIPLAIVFIFLIAILFTSLGIAIASMLEDMQGFHLIMSFLVMPIFFLSGSLFPLSESPTVLKKVAEMNPLTYGIDALRGILSGSFQFNLFFDFIILAGVTLLFLTVGSYLFSKIEI